MVKIKIKFIGLGINDKFQAHVSLYCNNKKILKETTYNGEITLPIVKGNVYILKAKFFSEVICTPIIYNKYGYTLFFSNNIPNEETITFLLRDFYYTNPIEKGEITLWQE